MHKTEKYPTDLSIVFFDGYCNLCNRSVDFLIRKDKHRKLHFASQQSEFTLAFFKNLNFDTSTADSIIFYHQGRFYLKTSAVLKIMSVLGFPYNLMAVFFVIPKFLRNALYNLIAANRYKWFGKRSTCRVPTEKEKAMFLDITR
ncbi:MAG: thiol-disulfide oxidoreductase DCC family protein [Flavobacteriales bacterium]